MMGHNGGPPFDGEGQEPDVEAQLEENEVATIAAMDIPAILAAGQLALLARLVGRCRLGTASHQEQAILRNILKDNGMTLGITPQAVSQPGLVGGGGTGTPIPADLPVYHDPEYGEE